MIERQREHSTYLLFEHLAAIPSLTHAVFTRHKGFSQPPFAGLNASSITGDDLAVVRRNKAEIIDVLGLPLVGARPIHTAQATVVERPEPLAPPEEWLEPLRSCLRQTDADVMLAHQSGFALCWAFGDCAPILLYDTQHGAFAMVHAGWRGTAAGVVLRAIEAMGWRYSTRPADLLAGVGPAIGSCCYAVNEQVRERFAADPQVWECARFEQRPADAADNTLFLDIAASNERQLLAAGVPLTHIESSGYCTGCRTDLFYSHRREPWPSGRFAVGIGLRD